MSSCVLTTLLILSSVCVLPVSSYMPNSPGDAKQCLSNSSNVITYEALPGSGFDNLRNKVMGVVAYLNYSRCLITEDQKFLLPDSVYIYPLKTSKVEVYSELIDHWKNFTSTTSKSINADAGLSIPHFSISGKFSDEYSTVKKHQVEDKAVTTRVQLRYVRYTARLQPDTDLHPTFKGRLLNIGAYILLNDTKRARYESQILVRDYGTHVITSVDGGASLSQVDQIKTTFVLDYSGSKGDILAAASASFFGVFHMGISYETTTSKTFIDQYIRNRTRSTINTHGGKPFQSVNFTANDWTNSIDNNLVSMDQSGDPLYYLITPRALPELSVPTVYEVAKYVEKAVEVYYKINMHYGCTNRDSPNFSFQANVEDGSCKPPQTNFTFGGVYQQCSMSESGNGDLCQSMNQKNPLTGDFSCPKNYKEVLITHGSLRSSRTTHDCHHCWLFFHCCSDHTHTSVGNYNAYWCVATGQVPQDSGYLFGGIFTSKVENPVTKEHRCPHEFYALNIGHGGDMSVCVSDDYELGYENSVPFAGFFSCLSGNPLAIKSNTGVSKSSPRSMSQYMYESGPKSWPHRCPNGYSQHTAAIDNDCEVDYCVLRNSLKSYGLPPVRRPPFVKAPLSTDLHDVEVIVGPGKKIYSVKDASAFLKNHQESSVDDGIKKSGLSAGATVAISVIAALVCIIVPTILLVRYKRKKMDAQNEYRRLGEETDPFSGDQNNVNNRQVQGYGANNSISVNVDS